MLARPLQRGLDLAQVGHEWCARIAPVALAPSQPGWPRAAVPASGHLTLTPMPKTTLVFTALLIVLGVGAVIR
jgi:hypothetical protein